MMKRSRGRRERLRRQIVEEEEEEEVEEVEGKEEPLWTFLSLNHEA